MKRMMRFNDFKPKFLEYVKYFLLSLMFFVPLAAYEVLYFLWMPYTKGIIDDIFIEESNISYVGIIIKLVFCGVYTLILSDVLLYMNKRDFGFVEKTDIIKIVIVSYLLRCMLDFLNCIPLSSLIAHSTLNLLLDIMFFIVMVNYIAYKCRLKIISIKHQIMVLVAFIVFSSAVYYYLFKEKTMYEYKYSMSGCIYQAYIRNLDLKMEIVQLSLTLLWLVSFIFILYVFTRHTNPVYEIKVGEPPAKYMKKRAVSIQILRAVLIFLAVYGLYVLKLVVYPYNSLFLLDMKNSSHNSYSDSKATYSYSSTDFYFRRMVDGTEENDTIYKTTHTSVYYKNFWLISFDSCSLDYESSPSWLYKSLKYVDKNYTYSHNESDDFWLEYFSSDMLLYFDDKKPLAVMVKDVYKKSENEMLTFSLETLIKKGCWDYFEYGYEYLLKYDADFIIPYIQRYAKGNFTEYELQQNTHMNVQYMTDFAIDIEKNRLT